MCQIVCSYNLLKVLNLKVNPDAFSVDCVSDSHVVNKDERC